MSFDRVAPFYGWLETCCAGSLLQRCRTAHLEAVREARQVLIVGEGTGRFLAACAGVLEKAHLTVVDASAVMLRLAQKRWKRAGGDPRSVTFILARFEDWTPPTGAFDLVVTHYFLDCFSAAELPAIVEKFAGAATVNARWLLADFQEAPGSFAKIRTRTILWAAYLFFRVTAGLRTRQLTPPDALLVQHGFELTSRRHFDLGLMHSDLWTRTAPT